MEAYRFGWEKVKKFLSDNLFVRLLGAKQEKIQIS